MAKNKRRSEIGEMFLQDTKRGPRPEGSRTVAIRLAPENEDTHELENICVIVKEIKGRQDYPPPFFPFPLSPIDSPTFTGVFGGRRWD